MKKIGILAIMIVVAFSQMMKAGTMKTSSVAPGPVIRFEFDFNSKKSNCMNPFGFCKFSIEITWEDHGNSNGLLPGRAYLNKANQLVILLKESDLQKHRHGALLPFLKGKKCRKNR